MTLTHCHFNLFSPLLVAANIYHEISNNEGVLGLSMEKTKDEFESGLKGFHGDLNLSLSVPNDSELLPAIRGFQHCKWFEGCYLTGEERSEEERSEGPKRHCEANAEFDII